MTRWQAVVFDLDDTLYAERDYVLSGLRAVATWAEGQLGLPAERSFAELRRLFEDGVRGNTFDRWLSTHGLQPDERVTAMVHIYRGHKPQIALESDVHDLLVRLRQRYRLGLLTDGHLEVQRRKVTALGLEHFFQAIVYSDALGREVWKPSPQPFQAMLRQLSVTANAAVYVGDNPAKDFRGARRVGMHTIRVRREEGVYRDLEPASAEDAPHVELASLDALEAYLRSEFQNSATVRRA